MTKIDISTTDNSNDFTDNQNYDVDIQQIYTSFIQQIDQIRSHVSVINNPKAQSVVTINSNNFISIDPNPQESRCHAFYRLIGLPVVASDGTQFYNPGYDLEAFSGTANSTTPQLNKQGIAISAAGLYPLMDARERYIQDIRQIFSVPDITSSVTALSSQTPRKFNFFVDTGSTDPFDQDPNNQKYAVEQRNIANTADFSDYKDSNGDTIDSTIQRGQFLQQRSHFIKPLMVDPRIDITVSPDTGLVCVPFTTDKSKTKLRDDEYLFRPLLEYVCRVRLTLPPNQDDLSQTFQNAQNYIKSINTSVDPDLLAKIYANNTTTIGQEILLKYLNLLRSMIDRLVESMQQIGSLSVPSIGTLQWIPIPNAGGPEFGSSTASINPSDPLNGPVEASILKLQSQAAIDQITNQTSGVTSVDLGNFAFDFASAQPVPDENTTSGFGNKRQDNLDKLQQDRTNLTDQANTALQTIEIIMGEFSGLGLCDIIAIYTALWSMDVNALVGLLDEKAFARLRTNSAFNDPSVQSRIGGAGFSITKSLTTFEDRIKEIYSIMDKFLEDRLQLGRVST
jgi:hypothetical protein